MTTLAIILLCVSTIGLMILCSLQGSLIEAMREYIRTLEEQTSLQKYLMAMDRENHDNQSPPE